MNTAALPQGHEAILAVVAEIPNGLHAQSRTPSEEAYIKFDLKLDPQPGIEFSPAIYPPGKDQTYEALGKLNIYTDQVIVYVPLKVKTDAQPGPVKLTGQVSYQACDDQTCYMPQTVKFAAETNVVPAGQAVEANRPELFKDYKPATPSTTRSTTAPTTQKSQTDAGPPSRGSSSSGGRSQLAAGMPGADWSVLTAFGAAFLAGLLFNIMPCVLPVLPLKAVGFYEVSHHRRGQSILFGLVFSAGVIAVFAILALLVLVLRWVTWGGIFQQAWFVWAVVALLALFSLSLFGLFTVNLPTGAYSFTPRHDTYTGNFLWGGLTAILATPCTAPLLPPLLLWATAQPAGIGVPAMLMVGVGMAFPYLLLSAMPEVARNLPRTGPWSELFKQMMGFLLLAAAVYFGAGRLSEGPEFWWLVLLVVAVACVYLIARSVQLTKNAGPVMVSSVLAVVALAGTLWWTARINGLLRSGQGDGSAAGSAGAVVRAEWQPFTPQAFDAERRAGKIVLVKFTANWCATCQYIEGTVFQDPKVWAVLRERGVVTFKADLTKSAAPGEQLLIQLNPAGGIPLTAIFAPDHPEPVVLASIYTSDQLLRALRQAAGETPVAAK